MPEPSAAGTHVPSHQPTWATTLGAWDDKMAINYHYLMNLPPLVVHQRYTARDTILYALGVGAGLAAANDPHYLRLVYEKDLAALPTMATVLAYPGFWAKDPKYGITWRKLLHRDQSIEIHGAIPVEGEVRGEMTIDEVYDRGAEKGAFAVLLAADLHSANGDLVATVRQVNVFACRRRFSAVRRIARRRRTSRRSAPRMASCGWRPIGTRRSSTGFPAT